MKPRELTYEEAVGYLAGIIDGEASVAMKQGSAGKGQKKATYKEIRIANTDLSIIAAVKKCLDKIGVHYTETSNQRQNWKRCYEINIYTNQGLRTIFDEVPLQSEVKLTTLHAIYEYTKTTLWDFKDRTTSGKS